MLYRCILSAIGSDFFRIVWVQRKMSVDEAELIFEFFFCLATKVTVKLIAWSHGCRKGETQVLFTLFSLVGIGDEIDVCWKELWHMGHFYGSLSWLHDWLSDRMRPHGNKTAPIHNSKKTWSSIFWLIPCRISNSFARCEQTVSPLLRSRQSRPWLLQIFFSI